MMIAAVAQVVGMGWIGGIQAMAEMYRKPEPPAEWASPQEWLELPRRTAGEPIPVVFGTVWMDEPHVFWVKDVRAPVLSIISGGGNLQSGFNIVAGKRRFTGGLGMVLCQGPLDTLSRIDIADQVLAGSSSLVVDGALLDLSAGADEIEVWHPHIHGAGASEIESRFDDGVAGRLGVAPGLTDQAGLVIPRWGTARGNLRNLTTAWMRGPGPNFDWSTWTEWPTPQILSFTNGGSYDDPYAFYLGAQPTLRPWRFLGTRCLGRAAGLSQWYDTKAEVDTFYDLSGARTYDMNPAHVLVELLCDPVWGLDLGDPSDIIDATSFQAMADAWATPGVGIGISWLWDRESAVVDIVRQIERIGDVALEHDAATDTWKLRSWTSAVSTTEIGDADIVDISIDVTAADELPTTIHVIWQDRRRDREQTYVLQDLAALHARGREIVHTWSIPMVASPVTVPQLARRELARLTTPRLRVVVEVMRETAASLRRTDPVHLVSTEHGLDANFRVVEWDHGIRTDGTVRLVLVQEPDADVDEQIWHEPEDPTEDTPEALPALAFHVEEMPLHAWWAIDPVDDLPSRLWAPISGTSADQYTRLWMWAPRPADRWDLTGWRWADRLLDEAGSPEGYITVSPELSSFAPTITVMTLDRGGTRYGEDTIEHDGARVLRVGDILAIPHTDESPITSLSSTGLVLDSGTGPLNRGGLASFTLDYSQMDGAYEFAVVTEVIDATHVKILGGVWDTLPAASIGGTSYIVGYYPAIDPWDCAPDELQIAGAGQVRRAPPAVDDTLDYVRDAVQTSALAVAGSRLQSFDDITPVEVPLSGADGPTTTNQVALTRSVRPLVGANFNLFDVYTGDGYVAITVEPRTRDSRCWAPSSLQLSNITEATQAECCYWPDTVSGDPPLILWIIDPASGDVIGTRKWDASGALIWTHPDEMDAHNAIYASSQLFQRLTFIVTAEGALVETPPGTLKSIHSWQYIRLDLSRIDYDLSVTFNVDVTMTADAEYSTPLENLHESMAAETGSLMFLTGISGTLEDLVGTVTSGDWDTAPTVSSGLIQPYGWTTGDTTRELEVTGDLIMRVKLKIGDASPAAGDQIVNTGGFGTDVAARNSFWGIAFATAQRIDVYHENGDGLNRVVTFTLPSTLTLNEWLYIVVRRTDIGSGNVQVETWAQQGIAGSFQQLSIHSVTGGTNNGDGTATLAKPSGGSTDVSLCVLCFDEGVNDYVGEIEFVHLKTTTTDDTTESDLADLVMV